LLRDDFGGRLLSALRLLSRGVNDFLCLFDLRLSDLRSGEFQGFGRRLGGSVHRLGRYFWHAPGELAAASGVLDGGSGCLPGGD
jgi:hypothetical protein